MSVHDLWCVFLAYTLRADKRFVDIVSPWSISLDLGSKLWSPGLLSKHLTCLALLRNIPDLSGWYWFYKSVISLITL